jgi:hypothetical protein
LKRTATFLVKESSCEFTFDCPKKWEEFTPTAVPSVRHCGACRKDVTLCKSKEEFDQLAEDGACVAIYVRQVEGSMRVGLPRSDSAKMSAFTDSLGDDTIEKRH